MQKIIENFGFWNLSYIFFSLLIWFIGIISILSNIITPIDLFLTFIIYFYVFNGLALSCYIIDYLNTYKIKIIKKSEEDIDYKKLYEEIKRDDN